MGGWGGRGEIFIKLLNKPRLLAERDVKKILENAPLIITNDPTKKTTTKV